MRWTNASTFFTILFILIQLKILNNIQDPPKMTSALPINPIRPMMPKKTGTTIDTTRSSGHSVVSLICRRSAASSHIRNAVAFVDSLHMLKYIVFLS